MRWEQLATIDAIHADVVRDLLADAGIEVRMTPWHPPVQLDVPPLVSRPMVEIEVQSDRREEAARLIAEFTAGGEEAALAEAEATQPPPEMKPAAGALWRRALAWLLGDKDHGPNA